MTTSKEHKKMKKGAYRSCANLIEYPSFARSLFVSPCFSSPTRKQQETFSLLLFVFNRKITAKR